jgi:hypothetical protein
MKKRQNTEGVSFRKLGIWVFSVCLSYNKCVKNVHFLHILNITVYQSDDVCCKSQAHSF